MQHVQPLETNLVAKKELYISFALCSDWWVTVMVIFFTCMPLGKLCERNGLVPNGMLHDYIPESVGMYHRRQTVESKYQEKRRGEKEWSPEETKTQG